VREAAVVAVEHPRWGERPVAAVVLRESAEATPEELRAYLAPRFASFWLPDTFLFVAQIPRTATGKFQKTVLRELVRTQPPQPTGGAVDQPGAAP
jgi:fatty-acyl-CoA synthase